MTYTRQGKADEQDRNACPTCHLNRKKPIVSKQHGIQADSVGKNFSVASDSHTHKNTLDDEFSDYIFELFFALQSRWVILLSTVNKKKCTILVKNFFSFFIDKIHRSTMITNFSF